MNPTTIRFDLLITFPRLAELIVGCGRAWRFYPHLAADLAENYFVGVRAAVRAENRSMQNVTEAK